MTRLEKDSFCECSGAASPEGGRRPLRLTRTWALPTRLLAWTAALAGAWCSSTLVIIGAEGLGRVLRPRGLVRSS